MAGTANHTHAAGFKRALDSRRVAPQRIGRRQGVGDEVRHEVRRARVRIFEPGGVDGFIRAGAQEQVRLHETAERGVLFPGRVLEATIALFRRHRRPADRDLPQLGAGSDRRAHNGGRVGRKRREPPQRRATCRSRVEADKRVGTKD